MQLLKKSSIKVVLFFSVIILVFLCMNCNFDHGYDTALNGQAEQPSSSNHNIDSIGSQFNPDSFSWDNVVFLNGGVVVNQDISGWSQTSEVLSASLSTRGVCVDHTQRTVWHSEINPGYNQLPDPWQMQGSIWIFIPRPDGKIYAAAFEGLRSRNNKPGQSAATGTECVLGYKGYDIAGVISYLVDKTKAIHLTGPNERAAFNPIQDWYPQPEDVLGFAVSTWAKNPADYRSGHRNERSDVVWIRVPDYNTGGGSGDVVGRSGGGGSSGTGEGGGSSGRPSVVCGQCSDTKNKCTRGVFHSHPPDTDDQYLWTCRNIPHRSDPRCDDGVDDDHRQIGCHKTKTGDERISAGPACTSKQRYPHYKTLKGKCLPSCGHAANMAGYGGKGSDGIARTSDDPHVYASRETSCSSVVRFGNDDWKDFSWVDKYTLRAMNSSQIKEVATSGGVCCVRGRPKNPTTPKVVPRTTKRTGGGETKTNTRYSTCNSQSTRRPPNLTHIVRQVANENPTAYQAMWDRTRQRYIESNKEFLDLVVAKLRETDSRFGYNCVRGGCHRLSIDAVAYFRGEGSPAGSEDVQIIDFLAGQRDGSTPRPAWTDVTREACEHGTVGKWKYPR